MEMSVRATYRGQVTKIVNNAADYLAQDLTEDHDIDHMEEELSYYIQRLQAAHDSLQTVNGEILNKGLIKEDVEKDLEKVAEYQDTAVGMLARLNTRLTQLKRRTTSTNIKKTGESSNDSVTGNSSANKLPRLPLKKFDGNYQDWLPFWEQFRNTVHENSQLLPAEKFSYLESLLTGDAKRVISGFTASESCYEAAISLLREQYGDTERIIDKHMQELIALRPVQSRTDVSGLRMLYTSVITCTRSLTAFQVPSSHYDVMLKSILLRCLPVELRIEFHREADKMGDSAIESDSTSDSAALPSEDKRVQSIVCFLKREVESLEKSHVPAHVSRKSVCSSITAANLLSVKDKDSCIFCKSAAHSTKDCDSDMPLVKKKEVLRKGGCCFRCARRGHSAKDCRSVKFLRCNKCQGKHLSSLCDPTFTVQKNDDKTDAVAKLQNKSLSLCAHGVQENVFLKTVRCVALGTGTKISVRVIIDGGSQYSYIRESLANKLRLKTTGTVELSVIPFGSKETRPSNKFLKTRVHLISQFNERKSVMLEVVIVPEICVDVLEAPQADCSLFQGIKLADVLQNNEMGVEEGLSILVGADFYWEIVTGRQRKLSNRLRAVETTFGWALQGPHIAVSDALFSSKRSSTCSMLNLASYEQVDVTKFWSLEAIGITNTEGDHDALTQNLASKYISKRGCRYVVKLPWRNAGHLADNKAHAAQRLNTLIRRLSRQPQKLLEYDAAIRQLIQEGIAEPVPTNHCHRNVKLSYLPHRPVYKEGSATTKLRVVFDASAREIGSCSLNDCLWTGANLLPEILGILLNFRLGRFGVVADLEKAFLQILLHEEDRDSHRFLWFSSPLTSSNDRPNLQEFRMTRVTFGVTCSPFLLCATLQYHLLCEKEKAPETCEILSKCLYMDDLVLSIDTEDEGLQICKTAIEILDRASLRLHKWNTNSVRIKESVGVVSAPAQKVLGILWLVSSDELIVPLDAVEELLESPLMRGTKRMVLQAIARIFDPIGIYGPVIVKLKILFQRLWKENVSWDKILEGAFQDEWYQCIKAIQELKGVAFPRWVMPHGRAKTIEIHIFADASVKAYGTVAFVRCLTSGGKISVIFLCARNRVAPLKIDGKSDLTLPKLELTAALIAARLHSYLQKHLMLDVMEYFMWTDSRIALSWIQGDNQRWKPYVQHRTEEIRRLTNISQWRHCKGRENPADMLTRGVSGNVLRNSRLWAYGPTWLQIATDDWKNDDHKPVLTTTVLLAETISQSVSESRSVLRHEDFSNWSRLLRVTGFIIRFIQNVRRKSRTSRGSSIPSQLSDQLNTSLPGLTADEIHQAERYWIRYEQSVSFCNEIRMLQKNKCIVGTSRIRDLSPFLDDEGILRVGGRLQMLDISVNIKHPILLPARSHIVNLIIEDCHRKMLHAGVQTIVTQLRNRFWILRAPQITKQCIKRCVVCRKLWGSPVAQPFAPLPRERISLVRPFDNVGIDFAGPLFCHDVKDEAVKCYILIFTCAAVRAVHLECVRSMSTEHFIMALKRFISRRGTPSMIISDNARTFRRAAIELQCSAQLWNEEVIAGFLSTRRIKWQFIVERAPWWGGFWERMIRTMKNLIKVTVGKAKLDFEQLRTITVEAELVINSRPLTCISMNPLDLTPLTPMDFLVEPKHTPSESNSIPEAEPLQGAWKHRMRLVSQLRKRWQMEYVQLLRSFHYNPRCGSRQLQKGDVVLLYDQSKPRIFWKMAVVEAVFIGRDKKIRACQIKLADGKVFRRPVQLLYPLELQSCPVEDVEKCGA